MSMPPGPRAPALVQTIWWMAQPVERLDAAFREYGALYTRKNLLFGDEVIISDPRIVKEVLTGDPEVFHAADVNTAAEPLVGTKSVLLLDKTRHQRMRRLMNPPLHGERMQLYAQTMIDVTGAAIDAWPEGTPFSLQPHMMRITLEFIMRTVFGLEEGANMNELGDGLTRLLDQALTPVGIMLMYPALQRNLGPLTPWAGFVRARERVDAMIYALIARRRAGEGAGGTDMLTMLLEAVDEDGGSMDDQELRDQLVTLLSAGHETTATALSWVIAELLGNPDALERTLAELDAVTGGGPPRREDLGRLEYLDAVIKEALRVRPISPLVVRRLRAPVQLGGYDLPAGVMVVPCPYLVQRHPDYWPEPARFMPERFLGKKLDPYAWFPFGAGARRCIGMAFALFEMKVVLATMLTRVRLEIAEPLPLKVALRAFMFAPKGGTRVRVTRRTAGASRRAAAA